MDDCKICKGDFAKSPDQVLNCDHHKGFVHLGCCTTKCSWDGKPCTHCKGIYKKQ